MKIIITYCCLFIFTTQLFAQKAMNQIEGRWVGTYGNNEKDAPYYFSFEFLPEGKMNVVNQNNKILATGSFSVIEDNIKIVYKYTTDVIQYACNGSLNKVTNTLSGTWQRIADAGSNSKFTQQGKWTMKKLAANESPAKKDDSLAIFNPVKKKDIVPINKKVYDLSNIKICTDLPPVNSLPLPPRVPSNYLTQYKINADGTVSPVAFIRQSLATYTEKMWEPGQTITVGFDISGAGINQMNMVKQYAREWELYANIKFEFLQSGTGMIRVGFTPGGSHSLIGRDALLENPNKTTMNLGWLNTVNDAFARQVILHEFGHALGFVHEHQTFGTAIPWDKEKVYAFYAEPPSSWSREKVDQNIFSKYSYTSTNYSSFDQQSIMLYPVPKELTTTGDSISWNMVLSATDKQYAALFYPFPTPPPTATGILKTGDDCDEIAFMVEFDAVARDKIEFNFQLGELNGKKVSWWKQIGIPQNDYGDGIMWVQNHSLIPAENITSKKALVDFASLNKTGSISFWKAKLLGGHTPLSYKWNIMQALKAGCRVTLIWQKDRCL
ncbi:M12 family metallopeptidase [Ferruginibacter sp.]